MFRLVPPLLLLLSATAFAIDQEFLEPVTPVSPVLKAQGGTSVANAEGFDSLFANPAGFSVTQPDITLLDIETTAQVSLSGLTDVLGTKDSWDNLENVLDDPVLLPLLNDIVSTGGLGGEGSVRMGWVGANLGVGLAVQSRLSVRGPNLLDAQVTYDQSYVGVIGMGWPFDVGLGTLRLGAALKPMQRAYTVLGFGDLLDEENKLNPSADRTTILSGFGMGWDLGARWDFAGFQTGLVVRDAGSTVISFKEYSVAKWASKGTMGSDGASSGTTLYRIPTVIGLGTSWKPDMGVYRSLVQPSITADLQIPIEDEFSQSSFWTWTHLGAEATILQFLSLRTGLNQGYFTFGLGLRVLFAEFNLAVYSDEMGRYSGTIRRPALSANLSFGL